MFRKVAWTPEIASRLAHPAGAACLPYLQREVETGIAELFHCIDGTDEAHMITRLDRNPTELVICYFEGRGMVKFGRAIVAAAHRRGIVVRAHTEQRAVERLLRRVGLRTTEFVMRSSIERAH